MSFDADAYAEALTPPSFTAGGCTYVGRVLSVEEWVALHDARAALGAPEGAAGARAFLARTFLAWFPAPWYARGPLVGLHRAWRAFRRLPDAAQVEAIRSFGVAQRAAGVRPALSTTATTP